jgi:hypothetical protein
MEPKEQWEEVDEVAGDLQAEILRGLLEAQEIQVWLSQEGAGKAIGLSLPSLGKVSIMVPTNQVSRAREILDEYYSGELEQVELDPNAVQKIEEETLAEEGDEDLL